MNPISGVASATAIMMAMLVTELDKRGALSKEQFADLLRQTADDAEREAPEKGLNRIDTLILRQAAAMTSTPKEDWHLVIPGDE